MCCCLSCVAAATSRVTSHILVCNVTFPYVCRRQKSTCSCVSCRFLTGRTRIFSRLPACHLSSLSFSLCWWVVFWCRYMSERYMSMCTCMCLLFNVYLCVLYISVWNICIYIWSYVYMYKNVFTNMHLYMYIYMYTYIPVRVHICIYAYIRAYICIYPHVCIYTCIYMYIYTCMHIYMQIYVHIHMYTYIHTYIHIRTFINIRQDI